MVDPTGHSGMPWWLLEGTMKHEWVNFWLRVHMPNSEWHVPVKGASRSGREDTYGYIDLVQKNQAWEIKPDTEYGRETGSAQLQRYCYFGGYIRGKNKPIFSEPIPYKNGELLLRYDNGVLYYRTAEKEKERQEQTDTGTAKENTRKIIAITGASVIVTSVAKTAAEASTAWNGGSFIIGGGGGGGGGGPIFTGGVGIMRPQLT